MQYKSARFPLTRERRTTCSEPVELKGYNTTATDGGSANNAGAVICPHSKTRIDVKIIGTAQIIDRKVITPTRRIYSCQQFATENLLT